MVKYSKFILERRLGDGRMVRKFIFDVCGVIK